MTSKVIPALDAGIFCKAASVWGGFFCFKIVNGRPTLAFTILKFLVNCKR